MRLACRTPLNAASSSSEGFGRTVPHALRQILQSKRKSAFNHTSPSAMRQRSSPLNRDNSPSNINEHHQTLIKESNDAHGGSAIHTQNSIAQEEPHNNALR